MREGILKLVNIYKKRIELLDSEIIRLKGLERPTVKDINDLRIIHHARILWKEVIQDLMKITDKYWYENKRTFWTQRKAHQRGH